MKTTSTVRVVNNELDFISLFLYFILSFEFLFFGLRQKCDTCHIVVTYVTFINTQSCDTEKSVEGPRTDDVI